LEEVFSFQVRKTGFPQFRKKFQKKIASAKKGKVPRIFRKFKELGQTIVKNNFCTAQSLFDNFVSMDTIGALSGMGPVPCKIFCE